MRLFSLGLRYLLLLIFCCNSLPLALADGPNFDYSLHESITIEETANNNVGLKDRFQKRGIQEDGYLEIRDFIAYVGVRILIPVFTAAGIIIAIIGYFKLMVTESPDKQKEAFKWILWGVIGVAIMVSAGYLTNKLVGAEGISGIFGSIGNSSDKGVAGADIAEKLYLDIFFPFVQLMIYFILGVLFINAVVHGFKFIFSNGEQIQKSSVTILVYSALGIIVTIISKTMVESVYGTYSEVINRNVKGGGAANIGEIGDGILEAPNFINVHTAINWAMGLSAFIIMIILIYQGYQLLLNPTSEEMITKLKKSLGYIFIGILVIGAGYLITNFFIVT